MITARRAVVCDQPHVAAWRHAKSQLLEIDHLATRIGRIVHGFANTANATFGGDDCRLRSLQSSSRTPSMNRRPAAGDTS